jgi:anti-anti-sigma factor
MSGYAEVISETGGGDGLRPPQDRLGSPSSVAQTATLVMDRPRPGVLVVHLRAAVDHPSCGVFEGRIVDELGREATCRVVVDLHDVTLLSAAALGMLMRLRRLTWRRDMRLVLVGASHHAVHQPLQAAGVLPLFDTRPTVLHALPAPVADTRMSGRNEVGR